MKGNGWVIGSFVAVGIVSITALIMSAKQLINAFDPVQATTDYVALQDNLYPLGVKSTIATHAASPSRHYGKDGRPDSEWLMGGNSSITSSTGRWAQ